VRSYNFREFDEYLRGYMSYIFDGEIDHAKSCLTGARICARRRGFNPEGTIRALDEELKIMLVAEICRVLTKKERSLL
jgi:hypothetical protein